MLVNDDDTIEEEIEGDQTNAEGSVTEDEDLSEEDRTAAVSQKVNEVLKGSFNQKFTEDDIIHLAPHDMKTGFYIDPDTVDKSGRFRYIFCLDMNGYDEVDMVKSIRNLMDSELMTNSRDGSKREAQFLDFGAHVLRISRDQFEDIVTDPEKCKSWAASLGRTIDTIKSGFDGAENEKADYKKETYPEVKQISPDSKLEEDLKADPTKQDVINGTPELDETQYQGVDGGI
jgi:Sec-independent protein translocase protein TatA